MFIWKLESDSDRWYSTSQHSTYNIVMRQIMFIWKLESDSDPPTQYNMVMRQIMFIWKLESDSDRWYSTSQHSTTQ